MNSKPRVVTILLPCSHGVLFSPMYSFVGQNVLLCSKRFRTSVNNILRGCVTNVVKSYNHVNSDLCCMANVLTELIATRDDRLQLSDTYFFSVDEFDSLMSLLLAFAPPIVCLPFYVQCTVPSTTFVIN
jgi:hypothetical protein